MNKRGSFAGLAGLLLAALLLAACTTVDPKRMKDPELVTKGKEAWNTKGPEEARVWWNNIHDPVLKAQYLAYFNQLDELDAVFEELGKLPAGPEGPLVAAWENAVQKFKAFPKDELKLYNDYKPLLKPVAMNIVRSRVNASKFKEAKEFEAVANEFLDNALDFSAINKEMELVDSFKAQDKKSESLAAEPRKVEEFDDQIAAYEKAIAGISKIDAAMAEQLKDITLGEGSPLTGYTNKVKKRRIDLRVEMEKKLRDRSYSFKERIGEEFARTPEGDQLGAMGPEDVLKFNEDIRANIEAMAKELTDFAVKYPKVIDKDMLKDVEDQKKALEDRIVLITAEVEKARRDAAIAAELASRGKVIIPVMIGLFNPVPGLKGNDAKSRPGKFRGATSGDASAWWWGMVDIPKGTMNDLVITVKDNRAVRIFPQNTKSGTLIDSLKLKDLVNRNYKVGNSWPVLNAGAQLPSGKYFFELQKNPTTKDYSGDVTVYSSFIMRMR